MCKFRAVVLLRTTRNCSKVCAARAARLPFYRIRPITFLVCDVIVVVETLIITVDDWPKIPRHILDQ